jgi:hypothetical protein
MFYSFDTLVVGTTLLVATLSDRGNREVRGWLA